MSSDDLDDFFVHTLQVQTYLGHTAAGVDRYADAVTVPGFLSRKQRFIRDPNGEQVVSMATYSASSVYVDAFAPKSRVTVPGENPTTVITRAVSTGGDLIDGMDRVKVWLI